jgi:DNA topoisomerase-1
VGRFGPYVRHDGKFVSLKRGIDDPMTITLDRAIELIEEKRKQEREKIIKIFKEDEKLQVLNGRYGPYIAYDGANYKIPKDMEPAKLTFEQSMEIVNSQKDEPKRRRVVKKATTAKKATTTATKKKAAATKKTKTTTKK